MFLRILILLIFSVSLLLPITPFVFALENVFDNPTFGDISGTASQSGGVLDSYPIAGDNDVSSEQYCIEKGMYLSYYTVLEPSPFGGKAGFNTSTQLWYVTSSTTKSVSQIICSDLPIIGQSNAGGKWVNNYWDTNFPGTASGVLSDILIKARVNPTLNMTISAEEINLGLLVAGVASDGSLSIEVGTNAISGISITARSQSGGLTNIIDNAVQINSLITDGVAENYTWGSTINGSDDSSYTSYTAVNTGANGLDSVKEIIETSTEYNVYTTNKPESTSGIIDDVTFNVSATPTAETPAGDYEDRVIFTVTGNF